MAKLPTLQPRISAIDTRRAKPVPKVADPLYGSSDWIALRQRLLRERGARCEECGRTDGRLELDHIHELRDGGAPLDPANARILCRSCHVKKTVAERAKRWGL